MIPSKAVFDQRYVLVFLVAFTSLQFGSIVNSEELRWKFENGRKFDVTITQDTRISTEANRNTIKISLILGYEMDWEVISNTKNGNAIVQQSFRRMTIRRERTKRETVVYDTDSEAEPTELTQPFADVYDKLVGIKFKVEMSPSGQIVNVDVSKEDTETIRMIPESMEARKLFEKRGLMEVLGSGGFELPTKAIEKGDSWPVEKNRQMTFGNSTVKNVYTYVGSDDEQIAVFKVDGTATLIHKPKNAAEKPLKLKSQTQTGTIKFDNEAGHITTISMSQEMETEKPYREMLIETKTKTISNVRISLK
jgi:hypothetical protein